ncbi:helix-turn-helix domain-containing protein [Halorientalis marina]|uniref:helix-turn-helix domain-containing protein n=1 Tax=Halorientalis marina TaxID=2931976 RepID=UPI001FF5C6DC|nr:helix-turn-helix domain-containing protein [Halorientalis marina]
MATVMEFTSPAAEFPLGSVFEELPGVTVELERIVPHDDFDIPYFWVRGGDVADIEDAFGAQDGVSDVVLVDSVEEEYLMRAEWDQEYVGIPSALAETHLIVLSGIGTSDGWHFEVRGETRDDVSAFRSYCQEHDVDIDITAVHALLPIQGEGYELTDTQQEALVTAFELGYFDSPRRCSMETVADELGITQQSLSSRLRRGHRRLIAATLVHGATKS